MSGGQRALGTHHQACLAPLFAVTAYTRRARTAAQMPIVRYTKGFSFAVAMAQECNFAHFAPLQQAARTMLTTPRPCLTLPPRPFPPGFLLEYLTHSHKTEPLMYPLAKAGKTLWCGLWAFLTLGFFVVTCRKNGCLMTIFSTLVITFALLAGGVWSPNTEQAAGYFGFFCGSSAIYAAFAFLYKIELGYSLPGVRPVAYL